MIKKLAFLGLLLVVLSAPAVSASTPTVQASPRTMQLSSWHSEILDGTIVGGTQSVTIVNPWASSVSDVTFRLGTPPCGCTLVGASATDGTVEGGVWLIGELAPGATVTLDLVYEGDL